jgi:CHAT domain-containing protein
MTRARESARRGDVAAAEADYGRAVSEAFATRDLFEDRDARISFTASADEVFDDYIDFLIASQRPIDAFLVADGSRALELVDSPTSPWRTNDRPGATRTSIAELQKALSAQAAIIEYRMLASHAVAWVLRRDSIHLVELPSSLAGLLRRIHGTGPSLDIETLSALYDHLLRPIAPHLLQASSIAIIADDELEKVPFAALYDRSRRTHFVSLFASTLVPSARLFISSAARFNRLSRQEDRVVLVCPNDPASSSLRQASREIDGIATGFPGAMILRGVQMTAADVLNTAEGATIFHYAGHGAAWANGEASSGGLVLGSESHERLTPTDIVNAQFPRLRLAFLNACETDSGSIYKSEGSVTIARSFFATGVPVVVAALWPVDDRVAGEISRHFYRHFRNGLSPAEALRQAQLAAMRDHIGSRADWAAFRVVGAGLPTNTY